MFYQALNSLVDQWPNIKFHFHNGGLLANFGVMLAFKELLPENINVTENTEESRKNSGKRNVKTNKIRRFAEVEENKN